MIFALVVLILVAGIAFIHYVQGLFSATLSAILCILAAMFALAYHETVVYSFLGGKMADSANAAVLAAMFAGIYLILRLIFDRSIPGNVRYPLLLDKVGAGVMGLVAGLFATGIMAISAQMLPFGPSIMGYARFDVADREVRVPAVTQGRQTDSSTFSELSETEDPINPTKAKGLLIPVDDLVVGTLNKLSDGGALAGERPLASIHPDWINELFGQRLGIQAGTKTVVMNTPKRQELKSEAPLYTLEEIIEIDAEFSQIRGPFIQVKTKGGGLLKPSADQMLLVVRGDFDISASDDDKFMRISTGAVRLVGVGGDGKKTYVNYTPLGTVDNDLLYRNRPDDPIVINLTNDGYVDFLFLVNKSDILAPGDPKSGSRTIKPGVFFEAKRMARVDLSGKSIGTDVPRSELPSQVIRKELEKGGEGRAGGKASAAPVAVGAPLIIKDVNLSSKMYNAVNPGSYSGDVATVTLTSGEAILKGKKFSRLKIDGAQSEVLISKGDYATSDLFAPEGKRIVQVVATPSGDDRWKWADNMTKWEVVDGAGRKYPVHGAFASVAMGQAKHMVAEWNTDNPISDIARPDGSVPTDVYLAFLVPPGESIKDVLYEGKSAKKTSLDVK